MLRAIAIGIVAVVAVGIGYGVGNRVQAPQIESLDEVRLEQAREIADLREQLRARQARVETLLGHLGDAGAERTELGARLRASASSLTDTEERSKRAQAALDEATQTIADQRSALTAVKQEGRELGEMLEVSEASQETVGTVLQLQAELLALIGDELNPNLGDGDLLAQQGNRAAGDQTWGAASAYFAASGEAFGLARATAEEAASRSKSLYTLAPDDLRPSFGTTHKQAEALARVAGAQELEFQGAASLYNVAAEWADADFEGSEEELERWGADAYEVEGLLEQALALLDEADNWAPDLWRQFESVRIQIREHQGFLAAVRFTILEGG